MPFTPATLRFFKQLAANNNKEWFEAHRDDYENNVRAPMRELIEELDVRFARFAPEIGGDPKRSMFRINRDIRFSKDKSPYKTNAGCWFHHRSASRKVGSEADKGSAGFYFHLQPGESFIGGGVWMPPRPQLNKVRDAIAERPQTFIRMVESLPKRFGGLTDERCAQANAARVCRRSSCGEVVEVSVVRQRAIVVGCAGDEREIAGVARARV